MQNPLAQLSDWFQALDQGAREDLAHLAGYFHPDEDVYKKTERGLALPAFAGYLESESLSNLEVVRRALVAIKLLDFALSSRDTEEGWTETLDLLLALRSGMQEAGKDSGLIDTQLNSFQEKKEKWLAIGREWSALKYEAVSDRNIMKWFALRGGP